MGDRVLPLREGFWNVRGSFKIGGVVDIGTQCSLVRRRGGGFVLLDAYTPNETTQRELDALTNGGALVEAILNLHPFHTVHVRRCHERYPHAKLYGTARHLKRFPELPWEPERTEDVALHAMFSEDLQFSVPRGVDFISKNQNLHFSSVLVLHPASATIHVDDTLMTLRPPSLARRLGLGDLLRFHPTLPKVLERRTAAAAEFRAWAIEIANRWDGAKNLCAAHTVAVSDDQNRGAPISDRIRHALTKVERILRAHETKFG